MVYNSDHDIRGNFILIDLLGNNSDHGIRGNFIPMDLLGNKKLRAASPLSLSIFWAKKINHSPWVGNIPKQIRRNEIPTYTMNRILYYL